MKYFKKFENFLSQNDMIVYHASLKKFKIFDFHKIGSGIGGSYGGYGMYFTQNKNDAEKYCKYLMKKYNKIYSYIYSVNVKDYNFYVMNENTNLKLSNNEIENILINIKKYCDNDTYIKIKNNFYDDKYPYSAYSFYMDILPRFIFKNDSEESSKFLKLCGYDGVLYINDVNEKIYVIFNFKNNDINIEKIKKQ